MFPVLHGHRLRYGVAGGVNMKLDLYREFYFFEWNRREQITSATNIPIALATILGGVIAFLLRTYPYKEQSHSPWETGLFTILIGAAAVSLLWGISFLIRSYHGYNYKRIPVPGKLRDHYDEIHAYHKEWTEADAAEAAEEAFDSYLRERLADATDRNAENNRLKAGRLHSGVKRLIASLVFAAGAIVPYLFTTIGAPDKVQRFELVTHSEGQGMISLEANGDEDNKPEQPATTPENPPPPPEGPPNDEIREDGTFKGPREKG